jgi:hypothetical protein
MRKGPRRSTALPGVADHPYGSQLTIFLLTGTARIAAMVFVFCGAPLFAQLSLPDSPRIHSRGRGQKRELEIGTSSSEAGEPRAAKSESTESPQTPSGLSQPDPVQPAMFSPLTSKEKLRYAVGTSISPLAFIEAAAKAGFIRRRDFARSTGLVLPDTSSNLERPGRIRR